MLLVTLRMPVMLVITEVGEPEDVVDMEGEPVKYWHLYGDWVDDVGEEFMVEKIVFPEEGRDVRTMRSSNCGTCVTPIVIQMARDNVMASQRID